MRIKENDRVKVIKAEGELSPLIGATGTVKRIYELGTGDIAAVQIIPDETIAREIIVKLPVENLEKVGPQENREAEIPEGAKRITKDEFRDALQKITSPEEILSGAPADPIHALIDGLSAIVFGHKVERILFEDKDAVILTENDLVGVLWNACDPVAVIKEIGHNQSAFATLLMSVSSVIVLRDLVTILFGESEND